MFLSLCHELFILLPSESEKDTCSAMFVGLSEGVESAVLLLSAGQFRFLMCPTGSIQLILSFQRI